MEHTIDPPKLSFFRQVDHRASGTCCLKRETVFKVLLLDLTIVLFRVIFAKMSFGDESEQVHHVWHHWTSSMCPVFSVDSEAVKIWFAFTIVGPIVTSASLPNWYHLMVRLANCFDGKTVSVVICEQIYPISIIIVFRLSKAALWARAISEVDTSLVDQPRKFIFPLLVYAPKQESTHAQ